MAVKVNSMQERVKENKTINDYHKLLVQLHIEHPLKWA